MVFQKERLYVIEKRTEKKRRSIITLLYEKIFSEEYFCDYRREMANSCEEEE